MNGPFFPGHAWPSRYSSGHSLDGLVASIEGAGMPAIPPILMDGVVFLYKTREEAEQHVRSGGTAFIVGKKIRGTDRSLLYIVSNRHVVWDGAASVIRVNRRDGGAPDIIETNPDQWVPHPGGDDLVVLFAHHLLDHVKHKIGYLPAERLLSQIGIKEFDIAVGDDVFMTGRFVNFQGETDNLVAARFGSISVMLSKLLHPLYKRPTECFAVEMRSRTGFSGSPVVVYWSRKTVLVPKKSIHHGYVGLLGINWGYIFDEEGENTWLNAVIPAWKLTEILEGPEMAKIHSAAEDVILSRKEGEGDGIKLAVAAASPPATDENPNGREDFTRLLGAAARKPPQGD